MPLVVLSFASERRLADELTLSKSTVLIESRSLAMPTVQVATDRTEFWHEVGIAVLILLFVIKEAIVVLLVLHVVVRIVGFALLVLGLLLRLLALIASWKLGQVLGSPFIAAALDLVEPMARSKTRVDVMATSVPHLVLSLAVLAQGN